MWSVLQSSVNKVREKSEQKENHISIVLNQGGSGGWQHGPLVGIHLLHHQPSHIHSLQRQVQVHCALVWSIVLTDVFSRRSFARLVSCRGASVNTSLWSRTWIEKKVIFKIIVINQQSGSSGKLRLKDKRFSAKLKILSSCQPFLASSARDMTVEARLRLTFTLSNTILGSTSMDQHVPTLSVHF